MDVRIPYTNLSEILEDEYVFVARCKARNKGSRGYPVA